MGTMHTCDGCGKVSPDKHDRYIANNWAEVHVKRSRGHKPWGDIEQDYLLCDDCMGFPDGRPAAKVGWLRRIMESLWWYFKGQRLDEDLVQFQYGEPWKRGQWEDSDAGGKSYKLRNRRGHVVGEMCQRLRRIGER